MLNSAHFCEVDDIANFAKPQRTKCACDFNIFFCINSSNHNLATPVGLKAHANMLCKMQRWDESQLIHQKMNDVAKELIEYFARFFL